ncbi:MAG: hypothetical protein LH491_07290 [Pseudoxanthomonas sp.]|nr:hypothetical protein [Pseudoxanthomonas sp.]
MASIDVHLRHFFGLARQAQLARTAPDRANAAPGLHRKGAGQPLRGEHPMRRSVNLYLGQVLEKFPAAA